MNVLRWYGGLAVLFGATPALAQTYTVTPILKNGPDVDKKVIAVIGDGYASTDQTAWTHYVDTNVLGAFRNDAYLRAHNTAFNIYRVDVNSPSSGVTVVRYSAGCGTSSNSDDVKQSPCNSTTSPVCISNDTAFDYIYTGCWGRCWIEGTSTTEASIKAVLDLAVPKRDYEIRIVNVTTGGTGGCGGGGKLVVTGTTGWNVVAHEFGHMCPGLRDEYVASAYANTNWPNGAYNQKNCSTSTSNSVWASFFTPGVSIPTTFDAATMNDNTTVGMFEGCATYGKGIYRPAHKCRMNGNDREFCPVCQSVFDNTIAGFQDTASDFSTLENRAGAFCRATGTSTVNYSTSGTVENASASSVDVVCPGRRHRNANQTWENTFYGEAFVVDRSSTGDVCCNVFARDTGGHVESGPTVCSAGSSASMQQLKLGLPKVNWDYTFAHYGVKCTLPPVSGTSRSSVLTYRVAGQRY